MRRYWFFLAVCLSVLTVIDLGVIVAESVTGKGIVATLPDSVRCLLVVDAVMSLPFDNNYKSHEAVVRGRNNCPK